MSVVLVPQFFGSLVYDRRLSRYYPFDRESTALLLRLLHSTAHELAAGARPGGEREAVLGLYRAFSRRGLFTLEGRLDGDLLGLTPPGDHLAGPLAVHLEVAAECNLRCLHCFAGPLPRRGGPLLTVSEIDGLCAELAGLGCFRLGLTGGEPLARAELVEILDCAIGRGLATCVTTNGLLLDETLARELGRRPLAWLNVSLDGPDAASNDALRGPGTFDRVLDRLALLRRHAEFSLAFTVTRQVAGRVEECAALARRVGARAAVFRPLYPVGRAADLDGAMPARAEYTAALARLAGAVDGAAELYVVDPFSPLARLGSTARVFRGAGCGAGQLVASVSADGTVSPCSFLGSAHEAGSIRERSFAEIWHDGGAFVRLRHPPAGQRFGGGCRARALAARGDAFAADPWQVAHARA